MIECKKQEYLKLEHVRNVDMRGRVSRRRRALTFGEVQRLVCITSPLLKAAYLLGVYCGLRRAEVESLCWEDIDLSLTSPSVRLKEEFTKNRKSETLPLRQDLAAALRAIMPDSGGSGLIFGRLPRFRDMKPEWIAAGIAIVDRAGRIADFHSLRKSCCTWMHDCGVSQRIAQAVMRHSDPHLTNTIYTDTTQFNLRAAVESMPSVTENNPNIPPDIPPPIVSKGQNGSHSVTVKADDLDLEVIAGEPVSHVKSQNIVINEMAPAAGFEPATKWLTATYSTAELCRSVVADFIRKSL